MTLATAVIALVITIALGAVTLYQRRQIKELERKTERLVGLLAEIRDHQLDERPVDNSD